MLDWLTHDGQASAANGYVPLPAQIQQLARTMLQQTTGPPGHTNHRSNRSSQLLEAQLA
jgi:hypothetical protein